MIMVNDGERKLNSYFDFVLTFWENITNNARPNTVCIYIFSQNVLGNAIKKALEWLGEGDYGVWGGNWWFLG